MAAEFNGRIFAGETRWRSGNYECLMPGPHDRTLVLKCSISDPADAGKVPGLQRDGSRTLLDMSAFNSGNTLFADERYAWIPKTGRYAADYSESTDQYSLTVNFAAAPI